MVSVVVVERDINRFEREGKKWGTWSWVFLYDLVFSPRK